MATVSMSNVFEACGLVHKPTQNLIICKRCRYALAPARSQVTSHLLRKHQVPLPVRKGLKSTVCLFRINYEEKFYLMDSYNTDRNQVCLLYGIHR